MKTSRRVLKIAAVVCSFSLIGLYVYDRAGGNLIQRIYPGVAPEGERPMMSSSKVKQLYLAAEQDKTASPRLLPGSKYAAVAGTHSESKPATPNVLPPNVIAIPQEAQPQPEESSPVDATPPRVMLHGSKSMSPLIPVPTPQETNQQAVPNGPGQNIPNQQRPQQSSKPTRNNPGQR